MTRLCMTGLEAEFKGEKYFIFHREVWLLLGIGKVYENDESDYALIHSYTGEIHKNKEIIGTFSDLKFLHVALLEVISFQQNVCEGKLIEVRPRVYCQENYLGILYPGWDGLQCVPTDVAPASYAEQQSGRSDIFRELTLPKNKEIH